MADLYICVDAQGTVMSKGLFDTKPPDPEGKGWTWQLAPVVERPPPKPKPTFAQVLDRIANSDRPQDLLFIGGLIVLARRAGLTPAQFLADAKAEAVAIRAARSG